MADKYSNPPLLELSRVGFSYPGGTPVLEQADLKLMQGRRYGLIGPNGSGKTTLFNLITGLARPGEGEVLFRGEPMRTEKDFFRLRRDIGLVFQNSDDQLFCPTVIEDVAFGPLNLGRSPEQAEADAIGALERVGLAGFSNRLTHRLSGGEKRLVALATVLAMNPKGVLLDEPTNDLDPDARDKLINIINEINLTFLIISHDWDFLSQTVTGLYLLRDKRVNVVDAGALHVHSHAHPGGEVGHSHSEME